MAQDRNGWVLAARAGELPAPGDHRAVRIGREGILLVRGDDLVLRAFYNVCRHRGHEVVIAEQDSHARALKCPYHGWVYGLDGDCRATPRFGDADLDRSGFGLVQVLTRTSDGDLYVDPAVPVAD